MEISKEYIKMCDCPEIQGKWNPFRGDVYWDTRFNRISYIERIDLDKESIGNITEFRNEFIWLPRQDQLQNMVRGKRIEIGKKYKDVNDRLVFDFNDFINAGYFKNYSMEQLWLAFVMKEKHNKQWDRDKWIL